MFIVIIVDTSKLQRYLILWPSDNRTGLLTCGSFSKGVRPVYQQPHGCQYNWQPQAQKFKRHWGYAQTDQHHPTPTQFYKYSARRWMLTYDSQQLRKSHITQWAECTLWVIAHGVLFVIFFLTGTNTWEGLFWLLYSSKVKSATSKDDS